MISKLRRKIMIALMSVMCLFLAIILASSFLSIQRGLDSQTRRAMSAPFEKDDRNPQYRTPVSFVSVSENGDITIESNQIYYLTEDLIREYIHTLSDSTENHGEIGENHLQYLRRMGKNGITYIFVDTQFEREFARNQIRNLLVIAVFSVLGFLFASWLLAQWMVKPVARAWNKQRQFVADASHELKTPLTVILSNTDMIISSGVITDTRNLQRLDNISVESQRMRTLVESLLSLARSDSTPSLPPKTVLNLSYQVSSTVLTLEPTVYDAGHTLISDIVPDLTMHANPQEITQLIEILLDNACKYSNPGTDIHLTLLQEKKDAVLSVSSQGNPLSKAECADIFERFYRTDASRGITQGYGLGLSIAAEIAQRCGGSISASSDGVLINTFQIRLPLTAPDDHSAADAKT